MSELLDLEHVIEDSIADAQNPSEPTPEPVEVEAQEPQEVAPEGLQEAQEAVLEEAAQPEAPEAPSKSKSKVLEDFDKKFGIDPLYPSGRENRIPYSRVKKIAQKAVRDARKEWETESSPKVSEFETKVKDYQTRIGKYEQFEQIMVSKPDQFLQMLSSLPAYKEIFSAIQDAFEKAEQVTKGQVSQKEAPAPDPSSEMPQPDQQLPDGSWVYSMKGLEALNAWNRTQARKETLEEVNKRFGPIEQQWQAQQRIDSLKPVVEKQISEARTWELFNENEKEIVEVLRKNPNISLEGAYRQVVFPKFKADREKLAVDRTKMREEILTELRAAPRSTTVSTTAARAEQSSTGPKSLEDIIAEQIKTLR